jgi:hypothetical protein
VLFCVFIVLLSFGQIQCSTRIAMACPTK